MTHSQLSADISEWRSKIASRAFKVLIAAILCSGVAGLALRQLEGSCMVPCLLSLALAWASQVAAFALAAV